MISKAKLKSYIDEFLYVISVEELIDKLLFIQKLESRVSESDNGNLIDEEVAKVEMGSFMRS